MYNHVLSGIVNGKISNNAEAIEFISQDYQSSYNYMKIFHVENELIKMRVCSRSHGALEYARVFGCDDYTRSKCINSYDAVDYARMDKNASAENIGLLRIYACQESRSALEFAISIDKCVHEYTFTTVQKDPICAYDYARNFHKELSPSQINTLRICASTFPQSAIDFVINVDHQQYNSHTFKACLKSPEHIKRYIEEVTLDAKEMDLAIKAICASPEQAYEFARHTAQQSYGHTRANIYAQAEYFNKLRESASKDPCIAVLFAMNVDKFVHESTLDGVINTEYALKYATKMKYVDERLEKYFTESGFYPYISYLIEYCVHVKHEMIELLSDVLQNSDDNSIIGLLMREPKLLKLWKK